jgi:hypothetical protein
MFLFLLLSCGDAVESGLSTETTFQSVETATTHHDDSQTLAVTVTLDGEPVEGALVFQGGRAEVKVLTDAHGMATFLTDSSVAGDQFIMASHHDARVQGVLIPHPAETENSVAISLTTFDLTDNTAFEFQLPGSPHERDTTDYCAHCHVTINEDWYESQHRTAASNPHLQDLYAGVASKISTQMACDNAGGNWWYGLVPGETITGPRCYLGDGVLPALNEDCGVTEPCDEVATEVGICADCHAPGINGEVGGRGLLEATGNAYESGVFCDVCHSVESVDITNPNPGVGGRLNIVRPSEPSISPLLGEWEPLTFGPLYDVANPFMGAVQRDHYHSAELCAGCHQYEQPVLLPGVSIDKKRWPTGKMPIHTTFEEWEVSPLGLSGTPCQACHMPPNPEAGNASDLYNVFMDLEPGIAAGWERDPGVVKHHSWIGPRSEGGVMLRVAAALDLETSNKGDTFTVTATVTNAGAGHALPTGEPLRSIILLVEATCDDAPLSAIGGDTVPDYGGHAAMRSAAEGFEVWPEAIIGDHIRVVNQTNEYHDYVGTGPFGDGRFSALEKGLPITTFVGESTILSVDAKGTVTLDDPLLPGTHAYRISNENTLPAVDGNALEWAGAPGFAFARVTIGQDGERMVPHFMATDIVSDNRILPAQSSGSTHIFDSTGCDEPTSHAILLYRPLPMALSEERRWSEPDQVIAEATR